MIKEIEGMKVCFRNEEETNRIIEEVFVEQEYKFECNKDDPFIIDCGSHIGLSILYFKSLFPEAKILGFEPNSENFVILTKNIEDNHLKDVRIENAALSDKDGTDLLRVSLDEENPWTWGDSLVKNLWGDNDINKKVEVKTMKLSSFIDKTVDMLKIDIEGYEQKILEEIKSKLGFVNEIIMEFHLTPMMEIENDYRKVINILKKSGFVVETYTKNGEKLAVDFVPTRNDDNQVYLLKAKK